MLSRALITVSLVALAAPVVFSSSPAEQAPAQIRFQAMDVNRDGAISRDEWQGNARAFTVHDWNGDGRALRRRSPRRRAAQRQLGTRPITSRTAPETQPELDRRGVHQP